MPSFLNALSGLGQGISQFAGAAGLELQKSQLQNQAAILADQLATTRETALQGQRQTFQAGENTQNREATATNLATTQAAEDRRNAATIAGSAANNAATNAAAMARTQAEINAPTSTEKLFRFLRINPDGSPMSSGAVSSAATNAPAPNATDAAPAPTSSTDASALTSTPSAADAGTAGGTSPLPSVAMPARSVGQDLIDQALGRPKLGSPEATRYAVAQDVDKAHPYWTVGQKAIETDRLVGEASGAARPRYSFSAPVTTPDPDDPSKTVSGVNRQNTKTGDIEFVRTDTNPNRPGDTGLGNRAEIQHQRVASAATMAAEAAKNIMELPAGSSTGWLGGRVQGGSLMGAIKESLANSVTSQDVQSYNVMLAGIGRNLSTIETSGLAPNANFTKSMDAVILKEGDSEITKMRKMAEIRQIVEYGLQPSLVNPRLPDVQKEQLQGVISKIQEAIPFTHHDITILDKSSGKTTMNDVMNAKGLGGGAAGASPSAGPNILRYDATGNRISP